MRTGAARIIYRTQHSLRSMETAMSPRHTWCVCVSARVCAHPRVRGGFVTRWCTVAHVRGVIGRALEGSRASATHIYPPTHSLTHTHSHHALVRTQAPPNCDAKEVMVVHKCSGTLTQVAVHPPLDDAVQRLDTHTHTHTHTHAHTRTVGARHGVLREWACTLSGSFTPTKGPRA